MNVFLQALQRHAERIPERPALVTPRQTLSWRSLAQAVERQAQALRAQGLAPGDRLAVGSAEPADTAVLLLAAWTCRAVPAPLPPQLPPPAREERLDELQPRLVADAQGTLHARSVTDTDDRDAAPPDLALILYTSGSTARPKGVMLRHANLSFTAQAVTRALALRDDDRTGSVLPLHHSYGLYQLWASLLAGTTLELPRGAPFGAPLAAALAGASVSVLPATPTLLRLLMAARDRVSWPSLRLITCASDALAPELAATVRQAWPQARLMPMYGLTECGRVSMAEATEDAAATSGVGRPLPGTTAWVGNSQGQPLAPGCRGEVWVAGPHVMAGYWRQPEQTAQTLVDLPQPGSAWAGREPVRALRTGDEAWLDAAGRLHAVGRRADVLKVSGEKVSATAVEAALRRHPGVESAAVVGIDDRVRGQRVVAHLVLRPGACVDAPALADHCRAWLQAHEVPMAFHVWPSLPATDLGKVDKARLRDAQAPPASAPPAG